MNIVWDTTLSHEQKVEQLTALRAKKFGAYLLRFSETPATQEQFTLLIRDLIAEHGLNLVGPWIVDTHRQFADISLADPDNRQKWLQYKRFGMAATIFLKPSREMPKPSSHKRTTKGLKKGPKRAANVIAFPGQCRTSQ